MEAKAEHKQFHQVVMSRPHLLVLRVQEFQAIRIERLPGQSGQNEGKGEAGNFDQPGSTRSVESCCPGQERNGALSIIRLHFSSLALLFVLRR